jgi:hypothetical protein
MTLSYLWLSAWVGIWMRHCWLAQSGRRNLYSNSLHGKITHGKNSLAPTLFSYIHEYVGPINVSKAHYMSPWSTFLMNNPSKCRQQPCEEFDNYFGWGFNSRSDLDHSYGARTFSGKSSNLYHDALILHVQALIRTSHIQLSFFEHLLPSIVNTVDCGFRYEVILGYDRGDVFYDTPQGREVTLRWFQVYKYKIAPCLLFFDLKFRSHFTQTTTDTRAKHPS